MLLLVAVASGGATETEIEEARTAYSISRELMSPFCPGRTLADCPSPDAAAVRVEILERVRAGVPPEKIRSDLELRFGETVRGIPRSALGWLFPVLVLAAGAGALGFALRRLSRRPTTAPGTPRSPELEEEIERELREEGL